MNGVRAFRLTAARDGGERGDLDETSESGAIFHRGRTILTAAGAEANGGCDKVWPHQTAVLLQRVATACQQCRRGPSAVSICGVGRRPCIREHPRRRQARRLFGPPVCACWDRCAGSALWRPEEGQRCGQLHFQPGRSGRAGVGGRQACFISCAPHADVVVAARGLPLRVIWGRGREACGSAAAPGLRPWSS